MTGGVDEGGAAEAGIERGVGPDEGILGATARGGDGADDADAGGERAARPRDDEGELADARARVAREQTNRSSARGGCNVRGMEHRGGLTGIAGVA